MTGRCRRHTPLGLPRWLPRHELVEVDAESHFIWFGRAAAEVWDRRLAFLRGSNA